MAYTALAPSSTGLRDRVAELIDSFRDSQARRHEFKRVYGELARMSNRDLNDIGVARGNIRDIALEAAYGRH